MAAWEPVSSVGATIMATGRFCCQAVVAFLCPFLSAGRSAALRVLASIPTDATMGRWMTAGDGVAMTASVVNRRRLALLVFLPALAAGCGTGGPRDPGGIEQVTLFEKDAADVAIPSGFGSSRVKNWRVVDDSTMVID